MDFSESLDSPEFIGFFGFVLFDGLNGGFWFGGK